MTSFSASDAALAGFRFMQRQPKVVLTWAVVFFLYQLVTTVLLILIAGDQLPAITSLRQPDQAAPEAAMAVAPGLSLVFLLIILSTLAIYAVMLAAAYRAQLQPELGGPGYIHLGRDEARFAVVIVLMFVLSIGYSFLVAFVAGLLGALGAALPAALKALYYPLLALATLGAFIYPFVRLSLAMPMTLMDRHIRLLESWKLTRGHSWPLLGAFFLAFLLIVIMSVAVWCVVAVVALAVVVGTGGSFTSLTGLFNEDTTSVAAYLTPTTMLAGVLYALLLAATLAVLTAPVATAYRFLTHQRPPEPGPEPAASAL